MKLVSTKEEARRVTVEQWAEFITGKELPECLATEANNFVALKFMPVTWIATKLRCLNS